MMNTRVRYGRLEWLLTLVCLKERLNPLFPPLERLFRVPFARQGLIMGRIFFIFSIITLFTYSFSQTLLSKAYSEEKVFNVGLKLLDFEYVNSSGKKEIVTTAIWYPTAEKPRLYTYHIEKDYDSIVAVDAPLDEKGGPYPLILFSHGGYGCGYNSAFFMEYLATHGYIAVAPDYLDTKSPDYREQVAFSRIKKGNVDSALRVVKVAKQFITDMEADRQLCISYIQNQRLNPASFILDKIIEMNRDSNSFLYQCIKEDAIGACGHSLGGLTTIGKIGAHPDKKFKDNRIKAGLIFSGAVYPFEDTISNIDVPLMLMTGDNDESGLGGGLNIRRRLVYDRANPPKFYLILKDATHFAFSNGVCGETLLSQAVKTNLQVKALCEYGLAFFEKYLRGSASADKKLQKIDSAWAYCIKEEKPGEIVEFGKEPPPGGDVGDAIKEKVRKKIMERRGRRGLPRRWQDRDKEEEF